MNHSTSKVLVVESDEVLRTEIVSLLREAGYEVSGDSSEGIKAVLDFGADAVILGADPPQLDCCDLLSEIKASESTRSIRVVMLSRGESAQRTRGLDLGADDVLSVPFDSRELLSRLRLQLRGKQAADESRERLRLAEENRSTAQQVVTAVNEERRTLRVGGIAMIVGVVAAGLTLFFLARRSQDQNTRVYAAITRLQSGLVTQQSVMDRSRQSVTDGERSASTSNPQKVQLQKESNDLRSQIAVSKPEEVAALRTQLSDVQGRLKRLENEGSVAQTIIQTYEGSVCLIHVVLTFRDHATGSKLHYAGVTSAGDPVTDDHNNPLVSLSGSGPEVRLNIFGTGFLASAGGEILTNHHVAEPWWESDDLKEMLDQGLDPVIADMEAYFPGITHGIAIHTEKISSLADVALVKADISQLRVKEIALASGRRSAVSGGPVVLLGYPTALDAILARAGVETIESIAASSKGDPKLVMDELARRRLIRPTATQGHIGDVLPDKIVYDAQTTSGGSGGPLFDNEGKVIGINFAMVATFGGSNFAVPVRFGEKLLNP